MLCPICSANTLFVRRFTSTDSAAVFFPTATESEAHARLKAIIEDLWGRGHCDIRACESCRFTFPDPYVAGDKRFYEAAWGDVRYPADKWEFHRALEFISKDARILEHGAGIGSFVRILLKNGYRDICATDWTEQCLRELARLGVRAGLPDSSFDGPHDVICAFQVVEHMADVRKQISEWMSLLAPKGRLIFSVPSYKMIEFNERELRWYDIPPNHIGLWYPETFRALCERTGFKLLAHETEEHASLVEVLHDAGLVNMAAKIRDDPHSLAALVARIKSPRWRHWLCTLVGGALAVPLIPKLWPRHGYSQLAVLEAP